MLVFGSQGCRADALGVHVRAVLGGRVLFDHLRSARLHVDVGRPIDRRIEFLGDQQSARSPIQCVTEAVAIEVDQRLGRLAFDIDVGKDHFVDAVEVPLVIRRHLVRPLGHSGVDIAGKYSHRPFVVAGALGWIPGRWISRAVVEQVERLVIAVPAPCGASACLPLIALPCLER